MHGTRSFVSCYLYMPTPENMFSCYLYSPTHEPMSVSHSLLIHIVKHPYRLKVRIRLPKLFFSYSRTRKLVVSQSESQRFIIKLNYPPALCHISVTKRDRDATGDDAVLLKVPSPASARHLHRAHRDTATCRQRCVTLLPSSSLLCAAPAGTQQACRQRRVVVRCSILQCVAACCR